MCAICRLQGVSGGSLPVHACDLTESFEDALRIVWNRNSDEFLVSSRKHMLLYACSSLTPTLPPPSVLPLPLTPFSLALPPSLPPSPVSSTLSWPTLSPVRHP